MSADSLAPWQCRTASSEAGLAEALAAALRGRYPGAVVRVQIAVPVVEASATRDGREVVRLRIHETTLAASLGEALLLARGVTP